MEDHRVQVSIVTPVYNEEDRIESSLEKIQLFMESKDYDYEVIVSDDGSVDGTKNFVKEYQRKWRNLRLIENVHKGKGPTLISGINSAKGEYIASTDIDLSVSIEELPRFLVWLEENNYDLAIATREGVGAKRVNEPYLRHFMGRVFNLLVQLLVLPGINDTQCGFKVFRASKAKQIFKHTKLYSINDPEIEGGRLGAFDVEMLYVARRLGCGIKEIPVTWVYGEGSKIHKFKDSYYNLMDVVKVRLNSMKGVYP